MKHTKEIKKKKNTGVKRRRKDTIFFLGGGYTCSFFFLEDATLNQVVRERLTHQNRRLKRDKGAKCREIWARVNQSQRIISTKVLRQNIVGTKVLRHNFIPSSTFSTNSKYQNKCWLTLYVYTAWYSKDTGISRSNGNMSKINKEQRDPKNSEDYEKHGAQQILS